jgi:CDP-diglyceride synthetase
MEWTEILWFLIIFVAVQFIFMKLLSRGKVSKDYMKNNTLTKLIAVSVMLIIMNFVDGQYIFIGLLALYTYIVIKWTYKIVVVYWCLYSHIVGEFRSKTMECHSDVNRLSNVIVILVAYV